MERERFRIFKNSDGYASMDGERWPEVTGTNSSSAHCFHFERMQAVKNLLDIHSMSQDMLRLVCTVAVAEGHAVAWIAY